MTASTLDITPTAATLAALNNNETFKEFWAQAYDMTYAPPRKTLPGKILMAVMEERMKKFVGMDTVKQQLRDRFMLLDFNLTREVHGLPPCDFSPHFIFTGAPGTGKTSVARLIASLYKEAGVTEKDTCVEITPNDVLCSPWADDEVKHIKEKIAEAEGGILFIDEAHNIVNHKTANGDNGRNVASVLAAQLTKPDNKTVLILAGYKAGIDEILTVEPGLKSRLPTVINFPNYTDHELAEIYKRLAASYQFSMDESCQDYLKKTLKQTPHRKAENFGNARYIDNLFGVTVQTVVARVGAQKMPTKAALSTITVFDIKGAQEKLHGTAPRAGTALSHQQP